MFKAYKIINGLKTLDSRIQSEIITLIHSLISLVNIEYSHMPMAKYYRTEALYYIDTSLNKLRQLLQDYREVSDYIPTLYDVVEYIGDIERLKGKTGYIVEIPKVCIGDKEQDIKYCTRVVVLGELTGEFSTDVLRPVIK